MSVLWSITFTLFSFICCWCQVTGPCFFGANTVSIAFQHTNLQLSDLHTSLMMFQNHCAEDSEKMNTGTNHCYNSLVLIQQFTVKPSATLFWTASFDSNVFSVLITHLPLEAILNPSFNRNSWNLQFVLLWLMSCQTLSYCLK